MINTQVVMIYWKQRLEVSFGRMPLWKVQLRRTSPLLKLKTLDVRQQHFAEAVQRYVIVGLHDGCGY